MSFRLRVLGAPRSSAPVGVGLAEILSLALLVAALFGTAPVHAQEREHDQLHRLGTVSFPTSCKPTVQPDFERAVAMLHSFWFPEAEKTFRKVAADDTSCAMAYWGIAMVKLGNPLARRPSAEAEVAALEAAQRAAAIGGRTARERGYIDAVVTLYDDHETMEYRERMLAYETAMARVVETNADDVEAAIFHSLALVANSPPTDLTFARQKKAAEVLTRLFGERPDHPGLAHYIIHAYDSPPLAHLALAAARRYADIAPSAPHALHMPSHIFTRLGLWAESVAMNRRSADVESEPAARNHQLDYMTYAYLQQGRDRAAQAVLLEAQAIKDTTTTGYAGGILGYNAAAMPARYALERSQWGEAAQVPVRGGTKSYTHAVTHFARAIGAARSGRPHAARDDVAELARIEAALPSADAYWAGVVKAQRLAAEGWIAHAEGKDDEALRLAREAADLEDTFEKHPVTPGPLLPARELLGDLLLELDQPAAAAEAYESVLKKEPNRGRALYGAARAAELSGDATKATERYRQFVELTSQADVLRPEIVRARAFVNHMSSTPAPAP